MARAEARPAQHPRPAAAAADVRDLRLLAARRGRAPARRHGRPRRAALVGPAGGLPHRDPRAGEGADGQERRHRAGRAPRAGSSSSARPRAGTPCTPRSSPATGRSSAGCSTSPTTSSAGEVVPPHRVVRHDGDDPYLVVAADKGTATFSDIANAISPEYGFWLGRRLRLRRLDGLRPQGDGHHRPRRLGVGPAPLPRPRRRRAERGLHRRRASATCPATCSATACCCRGTSGWSPRSTTGTSSSTRTPTRRAASPSARGCSRCRARPWADYDPSLISPGGGVFPRTAKSVPLSPRDAAAALDVDGGGAHAGRAHPRRSCGRRSTCCGTAASAPTSRRRRRPTPTSATRPTTRSASTRASCAAGSSARAATSASPSAAAIEFALGGGRINTDAIDNSAGVDCSDHEVNIKILLDRVVRDGDLTGKQRDALLAAMTDDVADLCSRDNDGQTRALSIAAAQARRDARRARPLPATTLERAGRLDRALERCPTATSSRERAQAGGGLTMPEFAVVLAYTKIALFGELLASDVPEDPFLGRELERLLPRRAAQPLRRPDPRAPAAARDHRDAASPTRRRPRRHHLRLPADRGDGRSRADVARAHDRRPGDLRVAPLWSQIAALDDDVPTHQISLLLEVRRLAERATRWLLRNRARRWTSPAPCAHFGPASRCWPTRSRACSPAGGNGRGIPRRGRPLHRRRGPGSAGHAGGRAARRCSRRWTSSTWPTRPA